MIDLTVRSIGVMSLSLLSQQCLDIDKLARIKMWIDSSSLI